MKMRDFSCEELKSLAVELPDEVSRYEAAGDFEGAGKAIDRWLEKPVGEAMKTRLRYEKYIIQELPKGISGYRGGSDPEIPGKAA